MRKKCLIPTTRLGRWNALPEASGTLCGVGVATLHNPSAWMSSGSTNGRGGGGDHKNEKKNPIPACHLHASEPTIEEGARSMTTASAVTPTRLLFSTQSEHSRMSKDACNGKGILCRWWSFIRGRHSWISFGRDATHSSVTATTGGEKGPEGGGAKDGARDEKETFPAGKTIKLKLGTDLEVVQAFNRFASSVNGCSATEFLAGAQQAYYSTAVLTNLFATHTENFLKLSELASAGEQHEEAGSGSVSTAADLCALMKKELQPTESWDRHNNLVAPHAAQFLAATPTPKFSFLPRFLARPASVHAQEMLQSKESDLQTIVALTSVLPLSFHFAKMILDVWRLQKENKANLLSIAALSDYILSSKLVSFAHLHSSCFYIADSFRSEANLLLNLPQRPLKQRTPVKNTEESRQRIHPSLDDIPNREEGTATRTSYPSQLSSSDDTNRRDACHNSSVGHSPKGAEDSKQLFSDHVDTGYPHSGGESVASKDSEANGNHNKSTRVTEWKEAFTICVNGIGLPPIPSTAQACALLTVDVVVPPERFVSNFEWYYKRLVGYENEYERIATARAFAQSGPQYVAKALDFLMRMLTGKPIEFIANKTVRKMISIPDNARDCPPATRKLMCMYLDDTQRWILSDLIPLAPVMSAKIPNTK